MVSVVNLIRTVRWSCRFDWLCKWMRNYASNPTSKGWYIANCRIKWWKWILVANETISKCPGILAATDVVPATPINSRNSRKYRHGRKHFNDKYDVDNTSNRIRVWLELGAYDGSGSVEVGQSTTLGIRAVLPGSIGVRIVDCAALDGLGEASQKLLDERGCPVDEQVSGNHLKF